MMTMRAIPNPGRARATAKPQHALEDASRWQLWRQVHDDAERAAKDAEREQAREIMRRQMLGVDQKWFWNFVNELLEDWRADARQARIDRDFSRAALIDNRVDALCKDLERARPGREKAYSFCNLSPAAGWPSSPSSAYGRPAWPSLGDPPCRR
jgi:hypothetical protein